CKEIDSIVDQDTIIIGDGGDFVGTAAYTVKPRRPGQWLDPGPLGTLGVGPGYAMAAKLARPKSNVIILYGDGAFGLHAMEFEAMARREINVVGIVGNEILSGKTAHTNSTFLARELRKLGVDVRRIAVIPDDLDDIARTVAEFHERFDLVFTSGGVGPTHDDITIEGIARAFARRVVR